MVAGVFEVGSPMSKHTPSLVASRHGLMDHLARQGGQEKKCVYIYIYGRKKQINYKFIPTSLFRGRPLIRGQIP